VEENRLITIYRSTADDSTTFRERTAAIVVQPTSSADTGNLAAITKNSTFQSGQLEPLPTVTEPSRVNKL
jgi:hypothetical protein